jgi:hypothetical protein
MNITTVFNWHELIKLEIIHNRSFIKVLGLIELGLSQREEALKRNKIK